MSAQRTDLRVSHSPPVGDGACVDPCFDRTGDVRVLKNQSLITAMSFTHLQKIPSKLGKNAKMEAPGTSVQSNNLVTDRGLPGHHPGPPTTCYRGNITHISAKEVWTNAFPISS